MLSLSRQLGAMLFSEEMGVPFWFSISDTKIRWGHPHPTQQLWTVHPSLAKLSPIKKSGWKMKRKSCMKVFVSFTVCFLHLLYLQLWCDFFNGLFPPSDPANGVSYQQCYDISLSHSQIGLTDDIMKPNESEGNPFLPSLLMAEHPPPNCWMYGVHSLNCEFFMKQGHPFHLSPMGIECFHEEKQESRCWFQVLS